MKFVIEMNAFELKETLHNGSLQTLVESVDLSGGSRSCAAPCFGEGQSTETKPVHSAPAEPVTQCTAVPATPQPVDPAVPAAPQPVDPAVPATPCPASVTVAPASVAPAPMAPVPTSVQQYTLDDLAAAAVGLMDGNRISHEVLQGMLARYGVESLPQLPKEQYGSFATELRSLGAQI